MGKSVQETASFKRTGLRFPVGRLHRLIKAERVAKNVSPTAAIALAAVLEYYIAEVLEVTTEVMKPTKMITPRDLLEIKNDSELALLQRGVITTKSGVKVTYVPKKSKSKKTATATEADVPKEADAAVGVEVKTK